jgi:hypothetical protein
MQFLGSLVLCSCGVSRSFCRKKLRRRFLSITSIPSILLSSAEIPLTASSMEASYGCLEIFDDVSQSTLQLAQSFFALAGAHAISDARLHVILEQASRGLIQRGTHGRELQEQVFTGCVLGQHALNPTYVPFDAAQPILKIPFNLSIQIDIFHCR